jgi:surfeit locus 1 family protein
MNFLLTSIKKLMNIYRYRFTPPIWATLLTLVLLALFVKLSIWQWHRYHYKKAMQESYATEMAAPPAPLLSSNNEPQASFKHVIATGKYDPRQFLLDNRIHNGQVGFDIITPFKLANNQVILVDRGFVAANASRQVLQDINPPSQEIKITGFLTKPEKGFTLGSMIEPGQSQWPYKIMSINPEILSKQLGHPLSPNIILLAPQTPNGFLRQWSAPNLWAERSLGYCFQWLAFAVLLLIIYIAMNLKKIPRG